MARLSEFLKNFRVSKKNPMQIQEKVLKEILGENKDTIYGKKFNFSNIKTIEDFREKVPIVRYPDIKDYIDRMKHGEDNVLIKNNVLYFATSSGTTGDSKFIPVTKRRMDFHRGEFLLWIKYMLKNNFKIIKGKLLYFAAADLNGYTEAKIPYGNISGYLVKNSSKFVKNKLVVNSDILNIKNFDEKMEQISILSLLEKNVSQIAFASAVQAILFFDYLLDNKDKLIELIKRQDKKRAIFLESLEEFKPAFIWPKLWLINCVKSTHNLLYLDVVKEKLGKDIQIRDPGIMASEGRISLGITELDRAGVIPINEGFFEFKEKRGNEFLDPVTIDKLILGRQYKVIMTTYEGLYRYNIDDVIEVVGFLDNIPLVQFVSRNRFLNITEEHAPETEIIKGVKKAMEKFGIMFRSFTVIPFIDLNKKPRYEILFEPLNGFKEDFSSDLLNEIDKNWQESILTYAETRNEFGRMDAPILSIVQKGNYDKIDSEVLVLRAQAKPVQVTEDIEYRNKFVIEKSFGI